MTLTLTWNEFLGWFVVVQVIFNAITIARLIQIERVLKWVVVKKK